MSTRRRGDARNRTGVRGFAGRCVTTPPRRRTDRRRASKGTAAPGLYSGAAADVAQLARASACHAEGRGFESHHPLCRKARLPRGPLIRPIFNAEGRKPRSRGPEPYALGSASVSRYETHAGARPPRGGPQPPSAPAEPPQLRVSAHPPAAAPASCEAKAESRVGGRRPRSAARGSGSRPRLPVSASTLRRLWRQLSELAPTARVPCCQHCWLRARVRAPRAGAAQRVRGGRR